MAKEKTKTIRLHANSDKEFFLIHGYTGSPGDFNDLPELLSKKFNANVKVICLKGHGTKVQDLDKITYEDLFNQIEKELKKDIKKGRKIILGGVSLGAIFALIFSAKYSNEIKGVFDVCTPYRLKFPFNLKGLGILGKYKKYWKKQRTAYEKSLRKKDFSYPYMHANGLKIVKQASKELDKFIQNINSPILSVHSYTDPIGHYKSTNLIHKKIKSYIKAKKFLNTKIHNVFFSMNSNETHDSIIKFIKDKKLFREQQTNKVAAIIPSFNEAPRIGKVLDVVTKSNIIDEIIVVDDGSKDNTEQIVKKYKNVKYIKNKQNIGKAGSMDKGVSLTDADIIFFCDADLNDLKQEIITGIIKPVKEKKFNMFIGLRKNFMQRSVLLFALNSGERAIRRIVWEELPKIFKHKWRIEAGLNYYVKNYFGGFAYKTFSYTNPIQEKKHGFIKGTMYRWIMYLDVSLAYIYHFLKIK